MIVLVDISLESLLTFILKIGSLSGLISLLWIISTHFRTLPNIKLNLSTTAKHDLKTGANPHEVYIEVPLHIRHTGTGTTITQIAVTLPSIPELTFERIKLCRTSYYTNYNDYFCKDVDTIKIDGLLTKRFYFVHLRGNVLFLEKFRVK